MKLLQISTVTKATISRVVILVSPCGVRGRGGGGWVAGETVRFVMESGSGSSQSQLVRDVPVRCDPARISGRGLIGEVPARRVGRMRQRLARRRATQVGHQLGDGYGPVGLAPEVVFEDFPVKDHHIDVDRQPAARPLVGARADPARLRSL